MATSHHVKRKKQERMKLILVGLLAVTVSLQAQNNQSGIKESSIFTGLEYKIESAANVGNGDHSPLWLNANKQGLSSINKDNAYVAAGIFKPMSSNKFAYSYGLELAGANHFTSDVFVQQAYLDLKYRKIQLSIGSKERNGELVNQKLSSGGLAFSGNALPIPQIRVEFPKYITVPYTNNWLSVKGHVAYGWFTDGNWQKSFTGAAGDRTSSVLYHSKEIFFKVERPDLLPLRFEFGLGMEAQFGGVRHYHGGSKFSMPEGFKDYIKALIPMHGGATAPESDQENIEGNMLGSYHFSLSYKVNNWEIRPYYEHYFEDQSMLSMKYKWRDGLIGLELTFPKNKFVSSMVAEYFGSMDQSGLLYRKDKNGNTYIHMAGNDNYYNNGFYISWTHWGMAIGNPLFMSPIYNKDHSLSFRSNRMTARHLGISGNPTSELSYRLLLSYTRNWGTYNYPYYDANSKPTVKANTSTLFELTFSPHKMRGWSFATSGATDCGSVYGKNKGVMLTVRKVGII